MEIYTNELVKLVHSRSSTTQNLVPNGLTHSWELHQLLFMAHGKQLRPWNEARGSGFCEQKSTRPGKRLHNYGKIHHVSWENYGKLTINGHFQ